MEEVKELITWKEMDDMPVFTEDQHAYTVMHHRGLHGELDEWWLVEHFGKQYIAIAMFRDFPLLVKVARLLREAGLKEKSDERRS